MPGGWQAAFDPRPNRPLPIRIKANANKPSLMMMTNATRMNTRKVLNVISIGTLEMLLVPTGLPLPSRTADPA